MKAYKQLIERKYYKYTYDNTQTPIFSSQKDIFSYKVFPEDIRKYYKYEDTSWTQPTLSSNGTMGGNSFACTATNVNEGAVYCLFDGNTATSSYVQCHTTSGDLFFYNPNKIKVTNLNILGWTDNNWYVQNCTLYGSNDYTNWTSITTYSSAFRDLNWSIDNQNYYKYYKISWNRSGNYGLLWRELTITATQQIVVESTEQDYDFYKDITEYKAFKI